jgi:hypothetical protein
VPVVVALEHTTVRINIPRVIQHASLPAREISAAEIHAARVRVLLAKLSSLPARVQNSEQGQEMRRTGRMAQAGTGARDVREASLPAHF